MTATSTLTPPSVTRAWSRVQRTVALVFVIAVFAVAAFVAGRASSDSHSPASVTPAVAPAAVVTPAPAPIDVPCHLVGRPC
jgi:hypothetical protein